MSINKCIFIGNCSEPEIIKTETVTIAKFGLAINESYKNKQGEKVDKTEWVNIVCYSKLAEIVEKYVVKGSLLYIEGKIKTRSWDDKEGNKHYTTEIVLNGFDSTLQMLGGKLDIKSSNNNTNESNIDDSVNEDNLPF